MNSNIDEIKSALENAITPWDMLQSKFYQAWSAGTLPVEGLRMYANEYGSFIAALPDGWMSQGDLETAEEEREHIELWDKFAEALDTKIGSAQNPAVRALIATAQRLFSDPVTALGALYAFEVQQPATSVSKLEGLRKHYSLSKELCEPYFETHSNNQHEAEKLLRRISVLSADDREKSLAASKEMAQSLRMALDGMHDATCGATACM